MKSLRCVGLFVVVLLGACDIDKAPAPPPKVVGQAPAMASEVKAAQAVAPLANPAMTPLPTPELTPSVPLAPANAANHTEQIKQAPDNKVTVMAQMTAAKMKAQSADAKSAKVKADNADDAHRPSIASKSKAAAQVVKDTRLPSATLDLSLPADMVKQLSPPPNVITAAPEAKSPAPGVKPLLPKMFPDSQSDPDFQLQGRLLSNEMQLQLRNEARREVDGAALDFKFKQ